MKTQTVAAALVLLVMALMVLLMVAANIARAASPWPTVSQPPTSMYLRALRASPKTRVVCRMWVFREHTVELCTWTPSTRGVAMVRGVSDSIGGRGHRASR